MNNPSRAGYANQDSAASTRTDRGNRNHLDCLLTGARTYTLERQSVQRRTDSDACPPRQVWQPDLIPSRCTSHHSINPPKIRIDGSMQVSRIKDARPQANPPHNNVEHRWMRIASSIQAGRIIVDASLGLTRAVTLRRSMKSYQTKGASQCQTVSRQSCC